jgi:hypothetical protein
MNDPQASAEQRIDAAKALLPYIGNAPEQRAGVKAEGQAFGFFVQRRRTGKQPAYSTPWDAR